MDESPPPDETTGPRLAREADEFTPLRLVLQPTGAILEVTQPDMVIGRHSRADVRLALPDVSRRHCRMVFAGGRWEVIDLKSLNGIWVNDQAVIQAPLNQGDTLRIGGFTFMVDLSKPVPIADPKSGILRSIFCALPPVDDEVPEPRRRAS